MMPEPSASQVLQSLARLAVALSHAGDDRDVFSAVIVGLGEALPYDACDLLLVEGGEARPVWGVDRRGGQPRLERWAGRKAFIIAETPDLLQMQRECRPLVISDVRNWPGWIVVPERAWVRSTVGMPLFAEDVLVGYIIAVSAQAGCFDAVDRDFLAAISALAGMALGKARLLEQQRQRMDELEAVRRDLERANLHLRILRALDEAILEGKPLEEIAARALESLQQAVAFTRGSIVAYDFARGSGRALATVGYHANGLGQGQDVPLELFGPPAALRDPQMQAVDDTLPLIETSPGMRALYEQGVRSGMNIPLVARGEVIGALNLGAEHPHAFRSEDRELARQVADLIALALEKARVTQDLQFSEEKFSKAFQMAPLLMSITRLADGKFLDANQNFIEAIGCSREEVIGHTSMEINLWVDPQDRDRLVSQLQEHGLVEQMETRVNTRGGDVRQMLISARPIQIQDIPCILILGMDITERVQAQQALQQAYQRTAMLLETTLDGYILADTEGQIVDVNPAYCQMVGYSREELVGMNINQLEAALSPREVESRIARFVAEGRLRFQTRHRARDRRILDLDVSVVMLPQGDKRLVAAFVRDITAQIENERRLRSLAARLSQVQEAERKALARELHDRVGQNLTALNLLLEMCRSDPSLPAETKVNARLKEALALVDETAARVRNVMAELRPPVLDDYGLLSALHWYAGEMRARSGLEIQVEGEAPVPRPAPEVELALFRITQEALTNVIKHAQARRVTIRLAREEGALTLQIRDDGRGFDPAALAAPSGESGWGLISMRERAEAIGGQLEVLSRPGEGTRVRVTIQEQS